MSPCNLSKDTMKWKVLFHIAWLLFWKQVASMGDEGGTLKSNVSEGSACQRCGLMVLHHCILLGLNCGGLLPSRHIMNSSTCYSQPMHAPPTNLWQSQPLWPLDYSRDKGLSLWNKIRKNCGFCFSGPPTCSYSQYSLEPINLKEVSYSVLDMLSGQSDHSRKGGNWLTVMEKPQPPVSNNSMVVRRRFYDCSPHHMPGHSLMRNPEL